MTLATCEHPCFEHEQLIHLTAHHALSDYHEAQDIAQDVCLAALRMDGARVENWRAWLCTVAKNKINDVLRRRAVRKGLSLDDNEAADAVINEIGVPSRASAHAELVEILGIINGPDACNILTPTQISVMRLVAELKYDDEEIADKLEITVGNVRTQRSDARKALRRYCDSL